MVWPRLKVFWFNKDNLTGHSEKTDRKGGKTISKCGQEWTLPAQLGQLKQDKVDRNCCEFFYGVPKTLQGYGIEIL